MISMATINLPRIAKFLVIIVPSLIFSQQSYTIEGFISASKSSSNFVLNEKQKNIHEKQYQLFQKEFLPYLKSDLTLPSYSSSITEVLQPDGNFAFRETNFAKSRIGLAIAQKIALTGGEFSISNSISRLDTFEEDQNLKSFSASWFVLNFSQPLNFFNSFKWDKKINSARQDYNEIEYERSIIKTQVEGIRHFFAILRLQSKLHLILKEIHNLKEYRKLLDLLVKSNKRMKLDLIDYKIEELEKDYQFKSVSNLHELQFQDTKIFLSDSDINLSKNDTLIIPKFNYNLSDPSIYVEKFLNIYPKIEKISLLELNKQLAQLKKTRFYEGRINIGVGFNNFSQEFNTIFESPNRSQSLAISFNMPLWDFGRKRDEIEIVRLQTEVAKLDSQNKKDDFVHEIKQICQEIQSLKKQHFIQEWEMNYLKEKTKVAKELLFENRLLLKDFNEIELEMSCLLYTSPSPRD